MSYGILIKESMSGWIHFKDEMAKLPFAFHINAYTGDVLNFGAAREVHGTAEFGAEKIQAPVRGTLTLKVTGPRYELFIDHPQYGELEVIGEKTYSLTNLLPSLTTCPMTAYHNNRVIGQAEVAYREPIWKFPLESVRLRKEEDAFVEAGQ